MTIHWCGTGLSAIPGLRRLLQAGYPVTVWNRTVEKARAEVGDLARDIRAFDLAALVSALQAGDVVVSMLPADMHVPLAEACLAAGADFVSSSYISPEMRALDQAARDKGLAFVNEVGLDPGIDHLMAHDLVEAYRASGAHHPDNVLTFLSYCGGVPKVPNDFRYKFSWSPLGVLKALRSPSRSLKDFTELRVDRPWNAITTYNAPLPVPEEFEVYPNRDSYVFIPQYHIDPDWRLQTFVRGTLRLKGWAKAWAPVFTEIETLQGAAGDARLKDMSDQFWRDNSYGDGDPDRVVLIVDLKAERDGVAVWHQTWVMDAWGDDRGTAMGRLVSVPVSLAVEAVLTRRIAPGVSAAPSDPVLLAEWLTEIGHLAQHMDRVTVA
jgi:saccharopine dehydrogenase (NADP+, L-glutamate forming)